MEESTTPRVHGIVLAGAYPSHGALDQLVPRPLLPVAQQPLISYSLRWMKGGSARLDGRRRADRPPSSRALETLPQEKAWNTMRQEKAWNAMPQEKAWKPVALVC